MASKAERNVHQAMLRAVNVYNSSTNAATGEIPSESSRPDVAQRIVAQYMNRDIKQQERSVKTKFKVGDIVRLKRSFVNQFEKSGKPQYHLQQYRVVAIIRTHPVASYELQSLDGQVKLPATVTQSALQ